MTPNAYFLIKLHIKSHSPMLQSNEKTTRSTLHSGTAVGEDPWVDDESASDYSFDEGLLRHGRQFEYVATNLVTGKNLTLADVIAEEVTHAVMKQKLQTKATHSRFRRNPFGLVDPKSVLKNSSLGGEVTSLLSE
jgi:hypothetical protein